MSKIYTFIGWATCFGEYEKKPYKHNKGIFSVTRLDDNEHAISQSVETFKLSPESNVQKLNPGFRGASPLLDEYGRLVTFNDVIKTGEPRETA